MLPAIENDVEYTPENVTGPPKVMVADNEFATPVPPFAALTGTARPIVPLVVIVPPVSPLPATMLASAPVDVRRSQAPVVTPVGTTVVLPPLST